MNVTLKNRQHLIFTIMLVVSVMLAIMGYHRIKKDMILLSKGEQLLAKQDFQGAIPLFVESFKLGNSSPKLLKSLGDSCSKVGSPLAIDAYRRFLSKFPEDRNVRINLARLLAWHGQYNESVIEYRKVLGENL